LADYALAASDRRNESTALICAVVYNMHKSNDAKAKTVEDFLPVEADE